MPRLKTTTTTFVSFMVVNGGIRGCYIFVHHRSESASLEEAFNEKRLKTRFLIDDGQGSMPTIKASLESVLDSDFDSAFENTTANPPLGIRPQEPRMATTDGDLGSDGVYENTLLKANILDK